MSLADLLPGVPLRELWEAVLSLRDPAECSAFFEDLCTVAELRELAFRLAVARMLEEGRTYEEIAAETGVSSATISRVKKALYYGAGGYRLVLDRTGQGGSGHKKRRRPRSDEASRST